MPRVLVQFLLKPKSKVSLENIARITRRLVFTAKVRMALRRLLDVTGYIRQSRAPGHDCDSFASASACTRSSRRNRWQFYAPCVAEWRPHGCALLYVLGAHSAAMFASFMRGAQTRSILRNWMDRDIRSIADKDDSPRVYSLAVRIRISASQR